MFLKLGLSKAILSLVFAILLVFSIISGLVFFNWIQETQASELASLEYLNSQSELSQISKILATLQSSLPKLFIERDPDKLEKQITGLEEQQKIFTDILSKCKINCEGLFVGYADYQKEFKRIVNENILLGKNAEAIESYIQNLSPKYAEILLTLKKISDSEEFKLKEKHNLLKLDRERNISRLLFILVVMILISFIASYRLSSNAIVHLTTVANKLRGTSNQVDSSSLNMANNGVNLEQSNQESVSSVERTSTAMAQILSSIKKNSEFVISSGESSEASLKRIRKGKETIEIMVQFLKKIETVNSAILNQISDNETELNGIVLMMDAISEKTNLINSIVFHTKLLSFNSSVEAARAGEYGRGFSVVAEEVGKLANMSGAASKEISDLLSHYRNRVREIAEKSKASANVLMIEGRKAMAEGLASGENCDQVFDAITGDAGTIQTLIHNIALSLEQQLEGVTDVTGAITQLESRIQINANVSKETTVISNSLRNETLELNTSMVELEQLIHGKKSAVG